MKRYTMHFVFILFFAVTLPVSLWTTSNAAGPKVSEKGNMHNLSALAWTSGTLGLNEATNTYQATNDANSNPGGQQVCIFCHTPHNANVVGGAPLWNREFSSQTFSRYTSQTLRIRIDPTARSAAGFDAAWQPDGASKLCLSCHDGVSSLGTVRRGGPITMKGADVISGIASFDPGTTSKMKTGHHPVSFTYTSTIAGYINTGKSVTDYVLPSLPQVKLDRNGKMQCTTCHNAHQNQSTEERYASPNDAHKIAPFWVKGGGVDATTDHDDVCKTCHTVMTDISTKAPW